MSKRKQGQGSLKKLTQHLKHLLPAKKDASSRSRGRINTTNASTSEQDPYSHRSLAKYRNTLNEPTKNVERPP